MLPDFLSYLDDPDAAFSENGNTLNYKGRHIPITNGIPRFTSDISYSEGNFSRLREHHATLQLDSRNGTTDREQTILNRTKWPAEFFKGKTILECGCGAGPDTEILRKFGARVIAVDIAGLDIAKDNIGDDQSVSFVQASILDLPFRKNAFDIVWCHRVIQHTPDPKATLDHILQYVKDDGAVFIHSYAKSWAQCLRWKYALRPLTRRMDSEKLYNLIQWYAPAAYKLTNIIRKVPGGKYINHVFIPFLNYRHNPSLAAMNDNEMIEYGIHDTFDALSPAFDKPLSARFMQKQAKKHLKNPIELEKQRAITLMRTKLQDAC